MGRIILVASGKGGTGKTTAAANLGAALSAAGKLTVAVDMDMGLRNLDIALGLESSIVYDICDVAAGRCTLDEALVKADSLENLYILSSPQHKSDEELDEGKLAELWRNLKERFEFCIIDAPAGLGEGFIYSVSAADEAIIAATPDISSLRDADRVIELLEDRDISDIRLVLNRVRPDLIERKIMMNADDCVDILGIPVLGIVPEDERLTELALNSRTAVSDGESKAGRAFINISKRILGETVPIMSFEEKQGFFKRLKSILVGQ